MNLKILFGKLLPGFLARSRRFQADETLFNYRRVWWYAALGTASVSLIPLLVLAIWNFFQFNKSIKAEEKLPVFNLVSNTEQSISLYLDERKSTLRFMLVDNTFKELSDPERLARILYNLKIAVGDIVDLGVISSDGVQRNYVGPYDLLGANYKDEFWFHKVTLRGLYISEVFMGLREFPHIVIAAKHEKNGGGFFVIRMTLDTKKFNGLIEVLRNHSASDMFLINDKGIIQTPSLYYGDMFEKIPFNFHRAGNLSDITEIDDEKGNHIILGYSRIKETPFTLIVIKPPMEFMEKQKSFLGELAGFLAISIIIILAVIFRVSSIMVGRIEEADHKRVMVLHRIEHTNKLASIGRLSAGVAHEINNPLAIINEKAGLLKDIFSATENIPQKENFIKIVDSILRSVERCSSVTYRLLGFARHIDVRMESIEPAALINEVLGFLGSEAEYRNIEITLNSEDDLPSITSDRGQLQQVFLNIINNAMAAVRKDGHIDIACTKADSNRIAVSIRDDGTGIPPKQLEKIFEPFFTTKGREGTGLGLSITYGIVKKLGGKIEVESEVSKGTEFIVTLPIVKP